MTKLCLLVPCYNEEEVVSSSATKLINVLKRSQKDKQISTKSAICFIDDGSTDKTWNLICNLAKNEKSVIGLKLSRNYGHQNALLAGMTEMKDKFDCIISIDADLQDDIGVIPAMIDKYQNGFEIVYGVRKSRLSDSAFKKYTARLYYKILNLLNINIITDHADFRLVSNKVLNTLSRFQESNLFLRGLFPSFGYPHSKIYYDRKLRKNGSSKYSFIKMLKLATDGITSFSIYPLRIITVIGFIVFIISILIALWLFIGYFFGFILVSWTWLIVIILFIGGLQILSLGIIGEYIGKIYIEVKNRPRYLIEDKINII